MRCVQLSLCGSTCRSEWVAVRSMVPRRDVNRIMDLLSARGAKAILASDIRSCRF
ncbi:MAG: hypothetical protein ACT4NY_05160 [Pseudonocardiales bacterium]